MTDRPPTEALRPPPTLEDRMLKYIEGHYTQIWIGIGVLAALVVYLR